MWTVNLEDGTAISSKKMYWTDLSKDKPLTGIQLSNTRFPSLCLSLSNYDTYYYTKEAVALLNAADNGSVVAEVIGAHEHRLGIGVEIRLSYTGNVTTKVYPLDRFSYDKSILVPGRKVEKAPKSAAA